MPLICVDEPVPRDCDPEMFRGPGLAHPEYEHLPRADLGLRRFQVPGAGL